jgi:hypothetical protein
MEGKAEALTNGGREAGPGQGDHIQLTEDLLGAEKDGAVSQARGKLPAHPAGHGGQVSGPVRRLVTLKKPGGERVAALSCVQSSLYKVT